MLSPAPARAHASQKSLAGPVRGRTGPAGTIRPRPNRPPRPMARRAREPYHRFRPAGASSAPGAGGLRQRAQPSSPNASRPASRNWRPGRRQARVDRQPEPASPGDRRRQQPASCHARHRRWTGGIDKPGEPDQPKVHGSSPKPATPPAASRRAGPAGTGSSACGTARRQAERAVRPSMDGRAGGRQGAGGQRRRPTAPGGSTGGSPRRADGAAVGQHQAAARWPGAASSRARRSPQVQEQAAGASPSPNPSATPVPAGRPRRRHRLRAEPGEFPAGPARPGPTLAAARAGTPRRGRPGGQGGPTGSQAGPAPPRTAATSPSTTRTARGRLDPSSCRPGSPGSHRCDEPSPSRAGQRAFPRRPMTMQAGAAIIAERRDTIADRQLRTRPAAPSSAAEATAFAAEVENRRVGRQGGGENHSPPAGPASRTSTNQDGQGRPGRRRPSRRDEPARHPPSSAKPTQKPPPPGPHPPGRTPTAGSAGLVTPASELVQPARGPAGPTATRLFGRDAVRLPGRRTPRRLTAADMSEQPVGDCPTSVESAPARPRTEIQARPHRSPAGPARTTPTRTAKGGGGRPP